MLGGLGLDLSGLAQVGHEGQVNEQRARAAFFHAHLANGFQKRLRFNIPYRAAHLDDQYVYIVCCQTRAPLDLVGDMRNHLNRTT